MSDPRQTLQLAAKQAARGPRRRGAAHSLLSLAVALGLLAACDTSAKSPLRQPAAPEKSPRNTLEYELSATSSTRVQTAPARLPQDEGPYYPSLMRLDDPKQLDVNALADVKACTRCHEAAGEQWAHSAHAHASFDNPWYRASIDTLREEVNFEASRHCGGCHDPLLLLTGKMDAPIEASDPFVTAGVTCLVCHSATKAASDGNAALTLTTAPVPIPEPGDEESLRLHRERLASDTLRSPALCGNCHRGFLGKHTGNVHHIFGMDTPGLWSGSAFAGSRGQTMEAVDEQTCNDCHMDAAPVTLPDPSSHDGSLRSHRFAASHTPLAQELGAKAQSAAIVRRLQDAVRVDLPVVHHNDETKLSSQPLMLAAGDKLALDVTVRSLQVGHAFPGGLKDMQDTWVELVLKDSSSKVIAKSGTEADDDDPNTFFLRALVVDASGSAETRHQVSHFGTVAYDHSVAPRGARVVRYALELPPGVKAPLEAEVQLHHRKHRKELREAACAATRSARGRAFARLAKRQGQPLIDGCAPQPVTLLAQTKITLGTSQREVMPASAAVADWERLYDHALGLSNNVQERLDEARTSVKLALNLLADTADDPASAQARANLLCLLGRVAARQGRTAEALALASEAETAVGEHAAIERVRADAYLQVWRFEEAVTALERLVRHSPRDTSAHRDLARARLSKRDAAGALRAAQQGLKLQPRDESLLRTQAVALRTLGHKEADAANEAYLHYRIVDTATQAKLSCDRKFATCARDRMPVVTIALSN